MANSRIVGQTDRLSASSYPWFVFKNDTLAAAHTTPATNAGTAFDALKAAIIAQLGTGNILRIKVFVDTDEVAP